MLKKIIQIKQQKTQIMQRNNMDIKEHESISKITLQYPNTSPSAEIKIPQHKCQTCQRELQTKQGRNQHQRLDKM